MEARCMPGLRSPGSIIGLQKGMDRERVREMTEHEAEELYDQVQLVSPRTRFYVQQIGNGEHVVVMPLLDREYFLWSMDDWTDYVDDDDDW
jgi:hypothetical protein